MSYHSDIRRVKCYYLLRTAHNYDMAILNSQLAKQSTVRDNEKMAKLITLVTNMPVSPSEFIRDVDETTNESIDSYLVYKEYFDKWPWNKRVLNGFVKWYTYTNLDTAIIKSNIINILEITKLFLVKYAGMIDEDEFITSLRSIVHNKNSIFTFNQKRVRRSFAKAMLKYSEIEKKVNKREGVGIACTPERSAL